MEKREIEIYTLIQHIVEDGEELTLKVTPYTSLEEAKNNLKEIVENDERPNSYKKGWLIDTDNDVDFLAYEEGYYATNHSMITIQTDTIVV